MLTDYSLLEVQRIILHDIPKKGSGAEGPILSQAESPLTDELQQFLQAKFRGTLKDYPFEIVPNSETPSRVPVLLHAFLKGNREEFVALSQDLAQAMWDSQSGVSPESLLALAEVSIGRYSGLVIAKIQRQEGLNLQPDHDEQGRARFNLEHLANLMLTGETRLYKLAFFMLMNPEVDDLWGLASDKQIGSDRGVAKFFLENFLGCRLAMTPSVSTEQWFNSAYAYITNSIEEPTQMTQALFALQSEMLSNNPELSVPRFASEHFDSHIARGFEDHMRVRGFEPSHSVVKDPSLISSSLKKSTWIFSSGIQVLVTKQSANSHIQIRELEDGRSEVVITDRITNAKAK